MSEFKGAVALLLGAAAFVSGCDRNMSIAEIEAKERTSRLYTTAMEDLQAGRTDPAIRGFEHVLVQEPRNYSAHFQLATLLQDIKKGKPCEIDAINGVVCEWGRKTGVPTPVNDRIVEIVKKEQAGELPLSRDNLKLFADVL